MEVKIVPIFFNDPEGCRTKAINSLCEDQPSIDWVLRVIGYSLKPYLTAGS